MADDWRPDVFGYTDYRAFLREYYARAKENVPAFSFRYFSKKAGFKSPNFLKLVMDGDRRLGPESVERFADAMGLNRDERRFFRHLVQFGQAKRDEERNAAFERITASRRFRQARRLDAGMFRYLSRWYIPAIREMAARDDFREDPAWIAGELVPKITPQEATEALELLLDFGLLVRDAKGRLTRGDPSLTTGHEVRSLAIANYHRQMLARAADSLENTPRDKRDISALTVCIEPDTVALIKDRIHDFREGILNLCDADTEPDRVYQLNIQLFPLSRPSEEAATEAAEMREAQAAELGMDEVEG